MKMNVAMCDVSHWLQWSKFEFHSSRLWSESSWPFGARTLQIRILRCCVSYSGNTPHYVRLQWKLTLAKLCKQSRYHKQVIINLMKYYNYSLISCSQEEQRESELSITAASQTSTSRHQRNCMSNLIKTAIISKIINTRHISRSGEKVKHDGEDSGAPRQSTAHTSYSSSQKKVNTIMFWFNVYIISFERQMWSILWTFYSVPQRLMSVEQSGDQS